MPVPAAAHSIAEANHSAPSGAGFRPKVDLWFAFIAFVTLVYGLLLERWSKPWIISDWLINYEAGFVRRGLPGELLYRLGHLLHLSPVPLVPALTLALYAVILLGLRSLVLAGPGRLWVWALLLSPATLSFPVLDSEAGFRKELLYLATLVIFVLLLRRGRLSGVGASLYIAIALVFAVLSHESLICYAPYFLAALLLAGRSVPQALAQCALPFALGLGAAIVCSHHLGDLHAAARICRSLGYPLTENEHGSQVCDGGAIAYLGYTRAMARQEAVATMRGNHYLLLYPALGVLALLPLVLGSVKLAAQGFRQQLTLLWTCAGISFAGSLVLFLFAIDWGRWIYLHALSMTILLLLLRSRSPAPAPDPFPRHRPLAWLALALYATTWSLPHYQVNAPYHFGYFGLLHHVFFEHHHAFAPSTPHP